MEKLFVPGKWLVVFCALFLVVWFGLQHVSNKRLIEEAKLIGNTIFSWTWPGQWQSDAEITDVSVVQKTDKDAVVVIKGTQRLSYPADAGHSTKAAQGESQNKEEKVNCSATLSFYKMSSENPETKKIEDYWVLGQVDFPEVE